MILPDRKFWAPYQRVSELLLSPKEGWRRMKWKLHAEEQRPEKRASSWEEGLSSLPEGEWPAAESQKVMTQDKVKLVWRSAGAESQRGMTQRIRRIATRKTKQIEKESINILFDET